MGKKGKKGRVREERKRKGGEMNGKEREGLDFAPLQKFLGRPCS